jgi:hypothetical protein
MTISTTNIKNSYSGNGSQTVFAYTFKILADADIQVIIRAATGVETVKSLTTHYTVSGAGSASGGNVTFTSGNVPTNTETIVIRRTTTKTQTVDLVENDPFTAETVEGAFDRSVMIGQEIDEEVGRSIKLSRTNTMTSTEFTVDAATRASKILGFDTNGELSVTSELGSFKGNWAASTVYGARDIIKDTSTNNIFIVNTAHTSSGSTPLTSNANSAKYDLLVDAASATTAQTAAAASATAAASSATAASGSATTATTKEGLASTSATNAATSETNAGNSATAAASSATAAAGSASAAAATFDLFDDAYLGAKSSNPSVDNDGDALADGALYFDTTNDVMKVYNLANTTWLQLTPTVTNQNNINTVAGISGAISAVNSNATNINAVNANSANINTVATNNTNVTNVGSNIASITTAATNLTSINSFANTYLGASSSAPTQDPDGSALDLGDLYFDTNLNVMKVYSSSGWITAASAVNGTSNRFKYTVSSSTTTITGSDDNSATLAYDAGFIDVYLNGVRMVNGSDVTVTSGTSVVFASAIGTSGTDTVDIVAFGTFELTNFSITAANDTPASLGTAGQALIVNPAGNALIFANASSAEVYGFNKTYTAQTLYRTVTVQSVGGSNKYFIDGVQQDTLELYEGNTYRFDVSDSSTSSHPFRFATAADAAGSTQYTTGVTTSGSQGSADAYVQIVVATGAPTLYYYCSNHSGMGGTANTTSPALNTLVVTTTDGGDDNITSATYAGFDDVIFAATGHAFSIDSNGDLIDTI